MSAQEASKGLVRGRKIGVIVGERYSLVKGVVSCKTEIKLFVPVGGNNCIINRVVTNAVYIK